MHRIDIIRNIFGASSVTYVEHLSAPAPVMLILLIGDIIK